MANMLKWNRPGKGNNHWPPYGDYHHSDYDPNRWEGFDMDHRIYDNGIEQLSETAKSSLLPYLPYPKYNSPEWREKWKGEYVACKGARGVPLNISKEDQVMAYRGLPKNFPESFVSRPDVIGLDSNVCFDRYSRYGPYGFDDSISRTQVEWKNVKWGELQNQCLEQNQGRYRPEARNFANMTPGIEFNEELPTTTSMHAESKRTNTNELPVSYHSRTAVLIRGYEGYTYEENDIQAIRAMITELSLFSGGEYQVFLFVNIKSHDLAIFSDPELYKETLKQHVPEELRDIAILWSEAIFKSWYPNVTDWQVYWHQFMCVQWFSHTHPEFDYIWNWETDARYIGNHYHFFSRVADFAAKQPRKLLWERNKRYYLPAIHGNDYSAFVEDTNEKILDSFAKGKIPPPVWGPQPYPEAEPPQVPVGPAPPTTQEEDKFSWGVGEEADFITLLPMFDPRDTEWSYKDKIWNYVPGVHPEFTSDYPTDINFKHPKFKELNRRVFINTVVRFSRGLLRAMHDENVVGRTMVAEMWPSTAALQHGLKAVYAPHPIWGDRRWDALYSDLIFNADDRVDGKWGEGRDSVYNHDREYNFQGWSWYYASKFPRILYRRWLGWRVKVHEFAQEGRVVGEELGNGTGMCLPGMILHPVKRMAKDKESL